MKGLFYEKDKLEKSSTATKIFGNYANYDPDKFLKDSKNTDFDLPNDNVNIKDVNELWQSFKETFTNIAEGHAFNFCKKASVGV